MLAEGAGVDASENHLFGPRRLNTAGGAEGLLNGGGAGASAGEGNGAVGAEVVATVLDFEEGAGSVFARIGEETFAVVAKHLGYAGHLLNFLFCHLCEASHDDNLGIGVLPVGLSDGVAAFLLGHGGDGAGVDEVEVGDAAPLDNGVTLLGEAAQEVGSFGVVEFASKGVGSDFHKNNFVGFRKSCIFAVGFKR